MRRNKFNSLRKFERLEDRRMMAADIDLDGGVLTVQGTNNNDHIQIAAHPSDSDKLRVMVLDLTNGGFEVLAQDDFDVDDVDAIEAYGLNGNDIIVIDSDSRAKLDGGNGNDELLGGRGNDELIGGAGNDTYWFQHSQEGSDVVTESANVDTDTLYFHSVGGAVNLNLASTAAQVVNSSLTLRLSSATGIENVGGTELADTIRGNSRNNLIKGGGGNDWLFGEAGNDSLFGEAGDDDLFGGGDRDSLYGGIGNDDLFGEAGNDWLYGEAGLDTLDGGADNDFLDGGQDGYIDRLKGGLGQDTFVKYKKRLMPFYDFEQKLLDYNSAVDFVITRYY